jgi:hypothetical protein
MIRSPQQLLLIAPSNLVILMGKCKAEKKQRIAAA